MPFIGNKPSAVPLTSADITDNVITSAKIVDGTITNTDIASSIITGQTAETSIAGGDQILIYDDSATALRKMTRTNFVAGIGGTNTPAFSAYSSAQQTITANTWTKVNYGVENYDTNTAYDTSTSRFTAPTAGKYFVSAYLVFDTASTFSARLTIRKNNAGYASGGGYYVHTAYYGIMVNSIVELAVNDYVEIFTYSWGVNSTTYGSAQELGGFQAFKIIE